MKTRTLDLLSMWTAQPPTLALTRECTMPQNNTSSQQLPSPQSSLFLRLAYSCAWFSCLLTSASFPLWLGHLAWYPNCFKAERNGTNMWIWRVIKDPTESRRSLAPSHLDGHLYLSGWTVSDETSEIHALISLIAHFGRMFSLARRLLAQAEGLTVRWSASGVSGVGLWRNTIWMIRTPVKTHTPAAHWVATKTFQKVKHMIHWR